MFKVLSRRRIEKMRDAFEAIGSMPRAERVKWSLPNERDIKFSIEVCDELLKRMRREARRVRKVRAMAVNASFRSSEMPTDRDARKQGDV
jgi:hypothetical protein